MFPFFSFLDLSESLLGSGMLAGTLAASLRTLALAALARADVPTLLVEPVLVETLEAAFFPIARMDTVLLNWTVNVSATVQIAS